MGFFDKLKKTTGASGADATKVSDADQNAAEIKVEEKVVAEKAAAKVKADQTAKAAAKTAGEKIEKTEKIERKMATGIYGVLIRPVITEKSSALGALNQYVFLVDQGANKIQVAEAMESRYQVRPVSVNILKRDGKAVRYGRTKGVTKGYKKAIITLPAGKSIQIYEGV